MNALTLKIITPEGERAAVACDSVTFFVRDNDKGEGGGSMGIRRGHVDAIAALEANSVVKARSEGNTVASFIVSGGFAGVKDDIVTIIAEAVKEG